MEYEKFFVYKITNLINKKIYIGKTRDINLRWQRHKTAARRKHKEDYSYIHKAMNKYGFENFSIEIVEEFSVETEALAAEKEYIKQLNTQNRDIGYNITKGGDGISGFKFNNDQKKRMNQEKKETYKGKNNPFYGKTHTEENKQKISLTMKKSHEENKEHYYQLNVKQCSLTAEQCLEIIKKYSTKEYSYTKLAEEYSTNIRTIHKIIYRKYIAIKHLIIPEEIF